MSGPAAEVARRALSTALSNTSGPLSNYARRTRETQPGITPAETLARIDRRFLSIVTATGAATGAAAAAPGVGIPAGIAAAGADLVAVTAASFDLAMAYADVFGVPTQDLEHRELLGLMVVVGDSAAGTVNKAAGRTAPHLAKQGINKIPMSTIRRINAVLGRNFVTKASQRGVIVLGRVLPFGIGAGIGGAGNYLIGRGVIRAARALFGPVPPTWSDAGGADEGGGTAAVVIPIQPQPTPDTASGARIAA
ncbi:MAG: hypothetical protein KGP01_05180 [Actinomycetales bacterium]|nr:hypothetical protein [Actinomycetales bacterium]